MIPNLLLLVIGLSSCAISRSVSSDIDHRFEGQLQMKWPKERLTDGYIQEIVQSEIIQLPMGDHIISKGSCEWLLTDRLVKNGIFDIYWYVFDYGDSSIEIYKCRYELNLVAKMKGKHVLLDTIPYLNIP